MNRLGNQLDYLGIVALIWGSMVPSVYYGFYCEPMLQNVYWAMVRYLKTFSSQPLTEAEFPDLKPFPSLLMGIHKPQIQNTTLETLSSIHLRSIRPLRHLSRSARISSARARTDEAVYRSLLGSIARSPIHPWSRHLRRTYLLSRNLIIL